MTIRGWDGWSTPSIGLVKPPCQVVIVRPVESDDPDHSSGRVCSWTAIKPSFQTPAVAVCPVSSLSSRSRSYLEFYDLISRVNRGRAMSR